MSDSSSLPWSQDLGSEVSTWRQQQRSTRWLGWLDEDEHWSHPSCRSPSSSLYKGWGPSVGQTEFFRHPTIIGPKLVILVTLRKGVVVPSELSLDRSVVLLSRQDGPMETTLEDLKKPWLADNTLSTFPRPLPDRLLDTVDEC